jgi:nucleotide-binding universal stress UspA family protein
MVSAEGNPGSKISPQAGDHQAASPFRILLAYDGSTHARTAVEMLVDLTRHEPDRLASCQVTLLAVMPSQYITGHEQLEAALGNAAKNLSAQGLQVYPVLKAGNPAATINDFAAEIQAHLIVIGAQGLRATLGIFLGGVAQQVVEYSSCPVLIVREPHRGVNRLLLVGDGSTYSRDAVEFIAASAGAAGVTPGAPGCFPLPSSVELFLMHVLPPVIPSDIAMHAWSLGPEAIYLPPLTPVDVAELDEEERQEGERILADMQAVLRKSGLSAKTILRRGDAATEIIQSAKERLVDWIVCGSRGLSQVTGWLLGSVSRKLVHYAGCSVLVVKS